MGKNNKNTESDELFDVEFNSNEDILKIKRDIGKIIPNDIKLLAKNESQKKLINSIKNNEITICAGSPGTGKTFVAIAIALSLLRKTTNRYKRIYLVKSVTTLKNEELGFIPGDISDKFNPYMMSYFINMEMIIKESSIKLLVENDTIRPFPLAYIKGASLNDCIIIADEMQNISIGNSKVLLTRIGMNSRLILLGDINQVDLKNKNESSLEILLNMFQDTPNIGTVLMDRNDINCRNPIITVIEDKFNEYESKK